MSGFPQDESNMFSLLRSNYTCISEEQAKELAKIITTNNEKPRRFGGAFYCKAINCRKNATTRACDN
jgi:hypothetical protein